MNAKKNYILILILTVFMSIPAFCHAVCNEARENIFAAENTADFEKKIEYYLEALEACPDDLEILNTITDLYLKYEYYDSAYGVIYRILSINKFNAEGYYKLAKINMIWEEYNQAEATAKKALDINNYYVDCYILLGDIKYYTRNYKEAMKNYKKALELSPDNPTPHIKIAELFFLFEKYEKVIEYLEKAYSLDNVNEETKLLKELIKAKMQNKYKEIRDTAEAVLKVNPNNLMALETLSMAMLEHESEKSECLEILTKVYYLEKQPFMKGKVEKEIEKIVNSIASKK